MSYSLELFLLSAHPNAAIRQFESADIRQIHLLANRIQTAAAREQNTQEKQYIRRNADRPYHCIDKAHVRAIKIFISLLKLFLTIPKKITKMILK